MSWKTDLSVGKSQTFLCASVMNFFAARSPLSEAQWGEAISLNILNVTAVQRRSALGPVVQSSVLLPSHPIPSQMLSSQSEISASPEMPPLPQIAFCICVRMSTMCMFNMWPLITARQSIKAIRATGAWARSMCWQNNKQTHHRTRFTFTWVEIINNFLK